MRKIMSLTAGLSFLIMILTSVILYVVPQGRVAYWAGWHLWGLSKNQWTNIHINVGLLFLLSLFFHVYYNWRPILSYLKDRGRRLKVFTREFNAALFLVLLFSVGTYWGLPPFQWVLDLNEAVKEAGARKYGEPPYGHAELSSLKSFASRIGLNLDEAVDRLRASGVHVENDTQSLKEIAAKHGLSPQEIYIAMMPKKEESSGNAKPLSDTPPPGLGRRTLTEVCREYGLPLPEVIEYLAKKGVEAKEDVPLKEIASGAEKTPSEIYNLIKEYAGDDSRK
ncbi:MAG: DUF4405 domain-containing protein [Deltaproteobacteria bacterium]|nr:DUF4405 domain-containing protein [Deltaproteobacteria bacterium]